LRRPSPWSVSLDHIVPVSKGGTHTRDNVQAAHLRCNQAKGDREGAEVAS
jgi:5-methylcytosine-specific restriction endonuclease McrA